MRFYLGTHQPDWLARAGVRLFISHVRLHRRKGLPRAIAPWALDSGGFSELSLHGGWQTKADEYIEAVYRYRDEIGMLEWASPQDWMCEPHMIERTGLSVLAHQLKTIENFRDLRMIAPDLPFIPVLQGWTLDDYLGCIEIYEAAGVDLTAEPIVGLGSVCRRQHTGEIEQIVRTLSGLGLRLHGFGVKTRGLTNYAPMLTSADSMAWSYNARMNERLPGCVGHKKCQNCIRYALKWREEKILPRTVTPML